MDNVNLPEDKAREPDEDARQPSINNQNPVTNKEARQNVTFAKTTVAGNPRNNRLYNNVLSQPPKDVSHKQKLVWLQQRRTKGLWAQCDDCDKWRYLPHVLDNHELPTKWYCWMNPDTPLASCTVAEVPIRLHDEEDLIHAEYAAGSVVLARMPGFPWWPAMVDDCPDTEQYYWLDGFCDIPTHYNVVFFDAFDVSRAWIPPECLMPYEKKLLKKTSKIGNYKKRIDAAVSQADDAKKLTLPARLAKYSFIARYNGNILSPKKMKNKDIQRFQNKLKRKFNVDFSVEFSDSEDEQDYRADKKKTKKKNKKVVHKTKAKSSDINNSILTETTTENLTNNLKDSLVVQLDSDSGPIKNNYGSAPINESSIDQEVNSASGLQETNETQEELENSQKSNDFDF